MKHCKEYPVVHGFVKENEQKSNYAKISDAVYVHQPEIQVLVSSWNDILC